MHCYATRSSTAQVPQLRCTVSDSSLPLLLPAPESPSNRGGELPPAAVLLYSATVRARNPMQTKLSVETQLETNKGLTTQPSYHNDNNESIPHPGQSGDEVWTTIALKRQLGSRDSIVASRGTRHQDLEEFASALSAAERSLSEQERQLISKRIERLTPYKESESSLLKRTNPSWPKGKETDLANWGGILFSGQELDVDTQRAVLSNWNNQQGLSNVSRNPFISRNPYDEVREGVLKPAWQPDSDIPGTSSKKSENPKKQKVREQLNKHQVRVAPDQSESGVIPPEAENGKVQLKEKADMRPIKRMMKKALTAKPVKIRRSKTRVIKPV